MNPASLNLVDRVVNYFSPEMGAARAAFRNIGAMQAAYKGAYPTRTSTPWGQSESIGGLPHLNLWVHRSMRDRARALRENNQLARSILDTAVENVIGNGFTLQMTTADDDWNRKAEELLNAYWPISDFHGRTWVDYQKTLARCYMGDGDVGEMLLKKGQTALVEGDYISSPYTKPSAFLHDGVELDEFGRMVQFYVMSYIDQKKKSWTPVKAKDFIFLANMKRGTQYRGETFFAQSFDLFDRHEGIWEAVSLIMEIAASMTVVQMANPTAAIAGLSQRGGAAGAGMKEAMIKKGMLQVFQAGKGEGVSQIKNEQPGGDFSPNIKLLIRLIGLSFGMPLEYVLMDFSEVSGQTAKAVMLAAQRSFEGIQKKLIDTSYTRKTRWRIAKFIKEGLLEDRPDAFSHRWHAEPWPYLDPVKELQASQLKIDIGQSTEEIENMARGNNGKTMIVKRAAELAKKRLLGIPIVHSTMVQEIGVKAPASNQEDVGTPDPGGEAPGEPGPGEDQSGEDPSTGSGQGGDQREAA